MDDSLTRKKPPCWYHVEDVGKIAINDAFLLKSASFFLIRKHSRQDAFFVGLVDVTWDVSSSHLICSISIFVFNNPQDRDGAMIRSSRRC